MKREAASSVAQNWTSVDKLSDSVLLRSKFPRTRLFMLNKDLKTRYALGTCSAGNYMFKVNNRNTRASCEISSKSTIKTPERGN